MKNFFVFLFACCAQAVSAHIAFFLCHLCQCAKWHKYRKYKKNSIYGIFGTEMPHGTLAQTSYMIGEFLYLLFIIMSINLHGGLTAVPLKIGKSAQGYVFY